MHEGQTHASLEAKVDALAAQVALLVEHQRKQQELIEEMGPILKEVMHTATGKLADMEARGYFVFGRESLQILDRLVTQTHPDELRQLGEQLLGLMSTVRHLTHPSVLAVADAATEALEHADEAQAPDGVLGMLKAGRDPEIRRGMAVAMEVLRQVGRASARAARPARMIAAPQLAGAKPAPPRPAPPKPAAPAKQAEPVRQAEPTKQAGPACAAPTTQGYLDDAQWSERWATQTATSLGIALGEAHWKVLRFAREEYQKTQHSPNLRRIVQGSGVEMRALYQLFPKAPGVTAARIAGIPKPVGCI
jgi:tRNA 2-thiouridine synthesizing protein E